MSFIESVVQRAKTANKHIVLPEGKEPRVVRAAARIKAEGIAKITILGNPDEITKLAEQEGVNISGIDLIDPASAPNFTEYAHAFYELRKAKGMTEEKAVETMKNPMYYGTMMVKMGAADGLVAGALCTTADTLRPGLQIVKTSPGVKTVSSCFVMEIPDCEFGEKGVFVFADCAINIQPDAQQLCDIAIASAQTAKSVVGIDPKVAMLSYSTKGSGKGEAVDKVVEATALVKEQAPDLLVDGELQADAALVETVARLKSPDSPVAGQANVLVFPDLQSGNIGYKLVQRLAKAAAIGPICQGFAKPINDLSRGCSTEDIVQVVALTCLQAMN
ncbi:MAG: phosphate acetyltransferase [Christensenellales bacterium]|jgi:phosphate acetyltransferase